MLLVDVVVPRARSDEAVRRLHAAGVVHLVPFRLPAGDRSGVFAPGAASVTAEGEGWRGPCEWLEALAATLGPSGSGRGPAAAGSPRSAAGGARGPAFPVGRIDDEGLRRRVGRLAAVRDRAEALVRQRDETAAELERVGRVTDLLERVLAAHGRLPIPPGYAAVGVVVPRRVTEAFGRADVELRGLTLGRCAVIEVPDGAHQHTVVLVFPGRFSGEVQAMLAAHGLRGDALPSGPGGSGLAADVRRLRGERARLGARIAWIDARLAALCERYGQSAALVGLAVRDRLDEASALPAAGTSEHLVVLSGWIPAAQLGSLRTALGPGTAVIERHPSPEELERAPVAFENPPPVRPFEPLASFVGLPRYGTLDPSPILAVTFPLFVGLMVGDAGYGFVLLVLLLALRGRARSIPLLAAAWPVAAVAAVSTIVFGVLYGEWFGDAGRWLGVAPLWLDRVEAVESLLLLAVAIGVAQVSLGLALGAVNGARIGDRREVGARLSELVCLVAVVVLTLAGADLLPAPVLLPGGAVLAVAFVALLRARRVIAPIELLGIVGNVLSYARLMAISLAAAMLGIVANTLGGLAGNLVVGLLIAVPLHALNVALGFFDATVQGLRLHYVEFFTKFVEPGHVRYAPFRSALGADRGLGRNVGLEGGP